MKVLWHSQDYLGLLSIRVFGKKQEKLGIAGRSNLLLRWLDQGLIPALKSKNEIVNEVLLVTRTH